MTKDDFQLLFSFLLSWYSVSVTSSSMYLSDLLINVLKVTPVTNLSRIRDFLKK